MIDVSVLIPLVIIALTQMIKMAAPAVKGWVTIAVAFLVAFIVAFLSLVLPVEVLGYERVTFGAAIISALSAVGVTVLASKAGGGATGDNNYLKG